MTDNQPLCRRTVERCAEIAEGYPTNDWGAIPVVRGIASAIRALPTQPERVGEVTEPSAAMIATIIAAVEKHAVSTHDDGGTTDDDGAIAIYRAMRAVELGEGE